MAVKEKGAESESQVSRPAAPATESTTGAGNQDPGREGSWVRHPGGEATTELSPEDKRPALRRSEDTAFSTGDTAMQRASFGKEHRETLGERGAQGGWRRQ